MFGVSRVVVRCWRIGESGCPYVGGARKGRKVLGVRGLPGRDGGRDGEAGDSESGEALQRKEEEERDVVSRCFEGKDMS